MSDPAKPSPTVLTVAVAPRSSGWIDAAVERGGGELADPAEARALVWTASDRPDELAEVLDRAPGLEWVQLPWAGVEPFVDLIRSRPRLIWTCAKGVYAEPVAEHALALLLAGFRHLGPFARAESWTGPAGRNLLGARVTILGGGGIARSLVALLEPFGCEITVVRRSPDPDDQLTGVARVVGADGLESALDGAEALVLALPLLDSNRGLIGARQLGLLAPGAVVVNVARGEHIVTDDLVAAMASGQVGAAGLDVTDPEPLPDGHPLWAMPQVLVTPHTANTPAMARPLLGARITANVAAFADGRPLVGLVNAELGY